MITRRDALSWLGGVTLGTLMDGCGEQESSPPPKKLEKSSSDPWGASGSDAVATTKTKAHPVVVPGSGRALVIGSQHFDPQAYRGPHRSLPDPIPWSEGDAVRFAEFLGRRGFPKPVVLHQQTAGNLVRRDDVKKAIRDLAGKTNPHDNVVVYYSGHGNHIPTADPRRAAGQVWYLYDGQLTGTDLYDCWGRFPSTAKVVLVADCCSAGSFLGLRLALAIVAASKQLLGLRQRVLGESPASIGSDANCGERPTSSSVPHDIHIEEIGASGALTDAFPDAIGGVLTSAIINELGDPTDPRCDLSYADLVSKLCRTLDLQSQILSRASLSRDGSVAPWFSQQKAFCG